MNFLKVALYEDRYYAIVDALPVLKYELDNKDYIGKAFDENNQLFCIRRLCYSKSIAGMKAFGGSKINIPLVDGTIKTLQDDYWDSGIPIGMGETVYVTVMTDEDYSKYQHLTKLKGYNILKSQFDTLLNKYLVTNRIYSLWEVDNPRLVASHTATFA